LKQSVVVGNAGPKNLAVNFTFQDNNPVFLAAMHGKFIGLVKPDVVAVSDILRHEIFSPMNLSWKTGEVVKKLEFGVGGDCVEIMLTINQAVGSDG
jgi:hypothetical protein